jgi:hypothetical protein
MVLAGHGLGLTQDVLAPFQPRRALGVCLWATG